MENNTSFDILFQDVFENFRTAPSFDLDDFGDLGEIDFEDIGDIVIDNDTVIFEPVVGVPITSVYGICVIGVPTYVDGIPVIFEASTQKTNKSDVFNFIPEPTVKSKKTDVDALEEIEAFLKECIRDKEDEEMVQQDYILFGDGGTSSRDLDRNKDIALTLKMMSAIYRIPLHTVYNDLGNITHFKCVKCGEHRPQRGALLCYYCGKTNTATFAELVERYLEAHRVV